MEDALTPSLRNVSSCGRTSMRFTTPFTRTADRANSVDQDRCRIRACVRPVSRRLALVRPQLRVSSRRATGFRSARSTNRDSAPQTTVARRRGASIGHGDGMHSAESPRASDISVPGAPDTSSRAWSATWTFSPRLSTFWVGTRSPRIADEAWFRDAARSGGLGALVHAHGSNNGHHAVVAGKNLRLRRATRGISALRPPRSARACQERFLRL